MRLKFFLTAIVVVLIGLTGIQSDVQAANAVVSRFDKTTKSATGKIRNDTNTALRQRAKDPHQKAAARKYSSSFDRVYGKAKSMRTHDRSRLNSGLRSSSLATVKSTIKTLSSHVNTLKMIQKVAAKDIKKMTTAKKAWWAKNKKYFSGRPMSASQLRTVGFWLQVYGTPNFTRVSLDPNKGARSYTGAIKKEQAYLKNISTHVGLMIGAYQSALRGLEARKKKLEAQLGKKKGTKKTPPAAPPQPDFESDM